MGYDDKALNNIIEAKKIKQDLTETTQSKTVMQSPTIDLGMQI